MNLTIEDINPTRKKVVVAIAAADYAAEFNKAKAEWLKNASVPGFRPGKAPEALILKKFRADIETAALDALRRASYKHGVTESKLAIHSVVNVEGLDFKANSDAEVTLTVDVEPTFTLPDYKAITVPAVDTSVSDEDVTKALDDLRRRRSDFVKTAEAAIAGDYVQADYTATCEGQPLGELPREASAYGSKSKAWEEAAGDEDYSVPAIVRGLVGLKEGDTATFTEAYPADFAVAAVAGKTIVYEVKVLEVRRRTLPEVNEAFLKALGVETETQLREALSKVEQGKREQDKLAKQREVLSDKLSKSVEFALPESAVTTEVNRVIHEIISQNVQSGVSEAEVLQHRSEIEGNAKAAAEVRAKLRFILAAIAKAEGIKVENSDIGRWIEMQSRMSAKHPDEIVRELRKDEEYLQNVLGAILMGKTLDTLVSKAPVA